jgi:hypothetical protein
MEVSGQLDNTAAFPPGDGAPGTYLIGSWVDPRAGLDFMKKRKISFPYFHRSFWSLNLYRYFMFDFGESLIKWFNGNNV